ncbi:MAG: hypothetical protein ACXABY_34665, partial [Candidatus Thorarchaeota archaeon]
QADHLAQANLLPVQVYHRPAPNLPALTLAVVLVASLLVHPAAHPAVVQSPAAQALSALLLANPLPPHLCLAPHPLYPLPAPANLLCLLAHLVVAQIALVVLVHLAVVLSQVALVRYLVHLANLALALAVKAQ